MNCLLQIEGDAAGCGGGSMKKIKKRNKNDDTMQIKNKKHREQLDILPRIPLKIHNVASHRVVIPVVWWPLSCIQSQYCWSEVIWACVELRR